MHLLAANLPLLEPPWPDWLAIASFAVTFFGFAITLWVVWQAKSAAQAARDAAETVAKQNQRDFKQYVISNTRIFFNESEIHIRAENWSLAANRLNDIADQVAQLSNLDGQTEESWSVLAVELRKWNHTMTKLASQKTTRFADDKWAKFAHKMKARLDGHVGPFVQTGEDSQ